jgi:hypothetical protein
MKGLLIAVVLLATSAAAHPPEVDPLDVPVDSWQLVDVSSLNSKIEQAAAAGDEWPYSALIVTLHLFGGDLETRSLSLTESANRGEVPDTIVVTIARDGFLDDSVRGDWHRVVLRRVADGTWRVHEARRAYRCWRGNNQECYAAELCL